MTILASFEPLLQPFAAAMTAPSFQNLTLLVVGWLFAPRRTVTGMLVAADLAGKRHHAAFHRLFAGARPNPDTVGLAVFDLIAPWCGKTILLAIDDTLCRPFFAGSGGRRMFGAGRHHDPLASRRRTAVMGSRRGRDQKKGRLRRSGRSGVWAGSGRFRHRSSCRGESDWASDRASGGVGVDRCPSVGQPEAAGLDLSEPGQRR